MLTRLKHNSRRSFLLVLSNKPSQVLPMMSARQGRPGPVSPVHRVKERLTRSRSSSVDRDGDPCAESGQTVSPRQGRAGPTSPVHRLRAKERIARSRSSSTDRVLETSEQDGVRVTSPRQSQVGPVSPVRRVKERLGRSRSSSIERRPDCDGGQAVPGPRQTRSLPPQITSPVHRMKERIVRSRSSSLERDTDPESDEEIAQMSQKFRSKQAVILSLIEEMKTFLTSGETAGRSGRPKSGEHDIRSPRGSVSDAEPFRCPEGELSDALVLGANKIPRSPYSKDLAFVMEECGHAFGVVADLKGLLASDVTTNVVQNLERTVTHELAAVHVQMKHRAGRRVDYETKMRRKRRSVTGVTGLSDVETSVALEKLEESTRQVKAGMQGFLGSDTRQVR